MPKPWYSITAAAAEGERAQVQILQPISSWSGANAVDYLRAWAALPAGQPVDLYINSPGGDLFEALAMFNGMVASGREVFVRVLGIAASAASYLAMVGTRVTMPENTFMRPHYPLVDTYDNADGLRQTADMLDMVGASLLSAYQARFKGTPEELDALMREDRLLTAAECFKFGLCDEVTPAVKATALWDVSTMPAQVQALMEAAPAPAPVPVPVPAAPAISMAAMQEALVAADLSDYAAAFAVRPDLPTMAHLEAAIRTATETRLLCAMTARADEAPALIRSAKPLAEVRAHLASLLAREDETRHVNTTPPGPTTPSSPHFDPHAVWEHLRNHQGRTQ